MTSRVAKNIEYEDLLNSVRDEDEAVSCPKLTIPEFQRNYVWKSVNIKDLFDSIKDNEKNYYLGNIVVVKQLSERSKIVDGQQRLVTLSLIAKKLIDITTEDISKQILKKLIWADDDCTVLRIEFQKQNLEQLYENIIYSRPYNETDLDGSQKILHSAFTLISKELEEITDTQSFIEKLLSLEFVVIVCPSDEDAYQLFEGLNSTGLSLSAVELTKNALLGKIKVLDNTQIIRAVEIWTEIEKSFEDSNITWFNKFLRHQWFSKNGYVNNSNLFREIKKEIINKDDVVVEELFQYLEELRNDSLIYISLRTANLNKKDFSLTIHGEAWLNIERLIIYIEKLGVDQAYSVLLAIYKYGKNEPSYFKRGDTFQGHIYSIWCFLLLVKYTKVSPSSFEKDFSDICKNIQLKNYTSFKTLMCSFFDKLGTKVVDLEDDFSKTLSCSVDYSVDDRGMVKFLLEEYLVIAGEGSDSEIELEHIVPLGNLDNWQNVSNIELLSESVERLGNLTLLRRTLNDDAGNKNFNDKFTDAYSKSKFTVNNKLETEWAKQFNSDNPLENAILPRGIVIGRTIYKKYFANLKKVA